MSQPVATGSPAFDFARLRRRPDLEGPSLVAVDATDRLLLDLAFENWAAEDIAADQRPSEPLRDGDLAVVFDRYGALTLGAAARFDLAGIRSHVDELAGERALHRNAETVGLSGRYEVRDLDDELLARTRVVLVQAPKSLAALRELSARVARVAAPDVTLYVGGRIKHLTHAINDVLAEDFTDVQASLARQKSRVIIARGPRANRPEVAPERRFDPDLGLWIVATGGAFAGTKLDIGTRFLLEHLPEMSTAAQSAIDLGCGTGVLAATLATRRPHLQVLATDHSSAAVASARATVAVNDLTDRVEVRREDGLSERPDASADLILCNPPFHSGAGVVPVLAERLFAEARRVPRPGGELWTVYNTHLDHRPALRRLVGATRVAGQNPKFTVTVTTPN